MEYAALFPSFPDDARLWVHAADRPLSETEQARLHEALDAFLPQWTPHGRDVRGAAEILHARFLLIAATLKTGDISGCGIDASVHVIDELGEALDVTWLPPLYVFYRDAEGAVQHASRSNFRALAERGAVTMDTLVFDPSLTTVETLREERFEQPAGRNWHARAFSLLQPAS